MVPAIKKDIIYQWLVLFVIIIIYGLTNGASYWKQIKY